MDSARIIIIDSDPYIKAACRRNLEVRGHRIVGEAGSVVAAAELVSSLTADDIDVAVVEANLTQDAMDGSEGEQITTLIHEQLIGVVVVGSTLEGIVRGSDRHIRTGDAWALDAFVAELPERILE